MKRNISRLLLLGVLGGALVTFAFVYRIYSRSIEAEVTLQAYTVVMNVLKRHLEDNAGVWPTSWEELARVQPEVQGPSLRWPDDIEEFRNRVYVDFAQTSAQVAAMDVETFSAVRQSDPNFGGREGRIRQILDLVRSAPKNREKH